MLRVASTSPTKGKAKGRQHELGAQRAEQGSQRDDDRVMGRVRRPSTVWCHPAGAPRFAAGPVSSTAPAGGFGQGQRELGRVPRTRAEPAHHLEWAIARSAAESSQDSKIGRPSGPALAGCMGITIWVSRRVAGRCVGHRGQTPFPRLEASWRRAPAQLPASPPSTAMRSEPAKRTASSAWKLASGPGHPSGSSRRGSRMAPRWEAPRATGPRLTTSAETTGATGPRLTTSAETTGATGLRLTPSAEATGATGLRLPPSAKATLARAFPPPGHPIQRPSRRTCQPSAARFR